MEMIFLQATFMTQSLAVAFVDPEVVVRQSQILPGSIVVDFGCGSGYFSVAFAQAVGEEGKVYAMDILPSALDAVASRAKSLGVTNICPKRANLERENGTGLPDASVDWVIMKDVLFQNGHKELMMNEASRITRPGGKVFVMEWNSKDQTVGPDVAMRLSQETLMQLAQNAGLRLFQECQVGDFHFAFIFEK